MERRVKTECAINHDGLSTGGISSFSGTWGSSKHDSLRIMWFGSEGLYGGYEDGSPTGGAFVEDVLQAAHDRLSFFQRTVMACNENAEAIAHIEAAMTTLARRQDRRKAEGTLGTTERP